jgi:hypothetical protein
VKAPALCACLAATPCRLCKALPVATTGADSLAPAATCIGALCRAAAGWLDCKASSACVCGGALPTLPCTPSLRAGAAGAALACNGAARAARVAAVLPGRFDRALPGLDPPRPDACDASPALPPQPEPTSRSK